MFSCLGESGGKYRKAPLGFVFQLYLKLRMTFHCITIYDFKTLLSKSRMMQQTSMNKRNYASVKKKEPKHKEEVSFFFPIFEGESGLFEEPLVGDMFQKFISCR